MFSASLFEFLGCNNIIFYGNWLPYSFLEENKIYAHPVTWDNIKDQVEYVLNNFQSEKAKVEGVHDKVIKMISWKNLIPLWREYLKIN
jgi:hypothetical protein